MRLTTTNSPCGIVHVQPDLTTIYLPLEKAEVHADIVDVSAIVTVTQYFWQHSLHGLPHAKYVFPVPARSAVCGFEMTAEDGTVITAVAKERDEARKEYENAVRRGQTAGLVEHVTDDVFSISLGALPGNQLVTTKVTYVLDLMEDDITDHVRLQIPMYIGKRYGAHPARMAGARQASPHRVSISADVRMQGAVKNITSPTHPTLTIRNDGSTTAPRRSQYLSEEFLTQDFVLCVAADGLDAPRCIAERASTGAVAVQLNVVPKFNLPPVANQEYIFLVDRSGSMSGSRIETAQRALVMLLRALPSQGTHFNIFSFGSDCDSLWPDSIPYDESSLGLATQHVDSMAADYGGTEISHALEKAFTSRRTDKPTACFVLTDGEAWNLDGCLKAVNDATKISETTTQLRVFTLGIGSTTSSEMCEAIARAGNGICQMATTSESIIGKCSKLVRASRTYILKNIGVDWGVVAGAQAEVTVRQAPAKISTIYPGHRFIVFAFIEDTNVPLPKEVVLCGQRDGLGEVLRFTIPVQTVEFPPDHPRRHLIPTLAARRLIMDLDDGDRVEPSGDAKALIVKLGTEYQLASRHTSFIAVDKRTEGEVTITREQILESTMAATGPAARTRSKRRHGADSIADQIAAMYDAFSHMVMSSAPAPPAGAKRFRGRARGSGKAARKQLATTAARKTGARTKQTARKSTGAAFPPPAKRVRIAADATAPAFGQGGSTTGAVPQSTDDKVLALVRLQSFDGSFPASEQLGAIVGDDAVAKAKALQVADQVWATVLAIAFLKKHMKDRALLDGLVEKAIDFLAQYPEASVDVLLVQAQDSMI